MSQSDSMPLEVGQIIPAFSLADANGMPQSLRYLHKQCAS
jgi:hypothetical protein